MSNSIFKEFGNPFISFRVCQRLPRYTSPSLCRLYFHLHILTSPKESSITSAFSTLWYAELLVSIKSWIMPLNPLLLASSGTTLETNVFGKSKPLMWTSFGFVCGHLQGYQMCRRNMTCIHHPFICVTYCTDFMSSQFLYIYYIGSLIRVLLLHIARSTNIEICVLPHVSTWKKRFDSWLKKIH